MRNLIYRWAHLGIALVLGRVAAVYLDFVVLHCIPTLLCHPSSSGSEQDGQVCMESNYSGFCWKAKVESIQCAECAGVGAPCLEETPKSVLWNSWLWHPLVAVPKVLSVRSRGGVGSAKPPQCFILVPVFSLNSCAGVFIPDMVFG